MADDYELWLAKEKRALADARYAEIATTLERIKSRAASFLGWSLTLSSASIAYAVKGSDFKQAAWCAGAFLTLSALYSLRVLRSTNWLSKNAATHTVDLLLEDLSEAKEATALNRLADATHAANEDNIEFLERDRALLRKSWLLALLGVVLSAFLALLFSQPALKLGRHVIESYLPGCF